MVQAERVRECARRDASVRQDPHEAERHLYARQASVPMPYGDVEAPTLGDVVVREVGERVSPERPLDNRVPVLAD